VDIVGFSGTLLFDGFTVRHGIEGGSGIDIEDLEEGADVTISNCFITENEGNGIHCGEVYEGCSLTIEYNAVAENGADGINFGGLMHNINGNVTIENNVIGFVYFWDGEIEVTAWGNAHYGINAFHLGETGTLTINENLIAGNGALGSGGIYVEVVSAMPDEENPERGLYITNNIIGAWLFWYDEGHNRLTDGNNGDGIEVHLIEPDSFVNIQDNFIAVNYGDGIDLGNGGVSGVVEILQNTIGGWIWYPEDWAMPGPEDGFRFLGNIGEGVYISAIGETGNVLIEGNTISENSAWFSGIHADGSVRGVLDIFNNIIGAWTDEHDGGHKGNAGTGVFITLIDEGGETTIGGNSICGNAGEGVYIGASNEGSTLNIVGNDIRNNGGSKSGVHVEGGDVTKASVNLNNIVDNDPFGVYYGGTDTLTLDAENNWWGTADGGAIAGMVSGPVDYEPYLGVELEGAKTGRGATLDATDEAGAVVEKTGDNTSITVAKYSGNPGTGSFSGDIGKYFDVLVQDSAGLTELVIKLYYTDDDIVGKDESLLVLYWWDGTKWMECSHSGVNPAPVDGFSGYIWAIIRGAGTRPTLAQLTGTPFGGGGTPPAGIGSTGGGGGIIPGGDNLPPQISAVVIGGITETTANISWLTDEPGTSQVQYRASPFVLSPLDETLVTEHSVKLTGLTPGTTYHCIAMSRDAAGNHAVSPEYTFTTLGEEPAAIFTSSSLSISPSRADIGESVTISVLVTNTGNTAGSYEVALKLNGVTEATKQVTLDAGASESVDFSVAKSEAGSYSVSVGGLSGSFDVGAMLNWLLLGGIIAGVVAVGLIIFFLIRRRAY